MKRLHFTLVMAVLCLAPVAGAAWARLDALKVDAARVTGAAAQRARERPSGGRAAGPERQDLALTTPFIGVVTSGLSAVITARVDGLVDSVHVRLGERIEAGMKLVTIDKRELRHRLAALVASQAVLRAEAHRARVASADLMQRAERRRAAAALPTPGISSEELASAESQAEQAALELQVAEARIAERQAQVEQLQDELFEADVRAPFSGSVAVRLVDPGVRVTRGTPLLRLVSTEGPRVRFALPPQVARLIEPSTSISVAVEDAEGELAAIVSHVSPEVEAASRLTIVEADFEDAGDGVEPSSLVGRKVRVHLTPRSLMKPRAPIGG